MGKVKKIDFFGQKIQKNAINQSILPIFFALIW